MPIWIAESSVVGSSSSAIADLAPVRPCSAADCSRERLAETSAISDRAKKPLRRVSRRMTRTSLDLMEDTHPTGKAGAKCTFLISGGTPNDRRGLCIMRRSFSVSRFPHGLADFYRGRAGNGRIRAIGRSDADPVPDPHVRGLLFPVDSSADQARQGAS